jgi:hypothetical protein
LSNFETRLEGKHWDITAIGFGVRGYANDTATRRFEGELTESPLEFVPFLTVLADTLYLYQKLAPNAPAVFNWGPASYAETVIRRAPITEDCTDKPGKLFVSVHYLWHVQIYCGSADAR